MIAILPLTTSNVRKALAFLAAASFFALGPSAVTRARAAELSEPVLLVATPMLDRSPFAQTVVLAAPLPAGGHVGFIVNRPTAVKLAALFPDDAAARQVSEPVYLGGTGLLPGVFAVVRKAPEGGGAVLPLLPGLFAVIGGAAVDRVIEAMPNEARYFVGLMLWDDDELEAEVSANAWEVRPATIETVLPAKANGLWNSLRSPDA